MDISEESISKMSCRFCGESFIAVPPKNPPAARSLECPQGHIRYYFLPNETNSSGRFYRLSSNIELAEDLYFDDEERYLQIFDTFYPRINPSIVIPHFDLDNLSLEHILKKISIYITFS